MAKTRKTYSIRIQQEAIDELDSICRFVFKGPSSQADLKELKKRIFSLKKFPERGTRVRLLEDQKSSLEIRFIEYKGYLIFYTIDPRAVIILHIAGPGQNWPFFFT